MSAEEPRCAECGYRKNSLFHRPATECFYPECRYDASNLGMTPAPDRPHPTPHHQYTAKGAE